MKRYRKILLAQPDKRILLAKVSLRQSNRLIKKLSKMPDVQVDTELSDGFYNVYATLNSSYIPPDTSKERISILIVWMGIILIYLVLFSVSQIIKNDFIEILCNVVSLLLLFCLGALIFMYRWYETRK